MPFPYTLPAILPAAPPKVSTLVDPLTSQNSAVWTATGTVAISGGELQLTPDSSYDTVGTYDATSSAIYLAVPSPVNGATDPTETLFALNQVQAQYFGNGYAFRIHRGLIYFIEFANNNGFGDNTSLTYDAVNHQYLRFRHDGTNMIWETSPDAGTWTAQRTKVPTAGPDLTKMYVGLKVRVNTARWFDQFNRADSTTSPGPSWSNVNGTNGVKSNQFYKPSTAIGSATSTYTTTSPTDNFRVEATLSFIGAAGASTETDIIGNSSSANQLTLVEPGNIIRTSTSSWTLGTGQTTRATLSGVHTDGDHYMLERIGTLVTAYRNGASIGSWNDTTALQPKNTSNRTCGLFFYFGVVEDAGRYDDFAIHDMTATTGSANSFSNVNVAPTVASHQGDFFAMF